MTTALCLSLGHNASAIMVCDGKIVAGYEEERLSGVKSDSHFPIKSIKRLLQDYPVSKSALHVCISHWYLDGKLDANDDKHLNVEYLDLISKRENWHCVNTEFTHHDAHYEVAKVFAGREYSQDALGVVLDGFGTLGEVVTIYLGDRLIHRSFGLNFSYGLLYQYATSYMGMVENQDEYKLLGYEAHYIPNDLMNGLVAKYANKYTESNMVNKLGEPGDAMLSLSALSYTRIWVYSMLDDVLDTLGYESGSIKDLRPALSYFVQGVLEESVINLLSIFGGRTALLSGGVFMNVKLNMALMNYFDKICILPVCGDQGAGLGVYQKVFGNLVWPEHLFWGHRDLNVPEGIEGTYKIAQSDLKEAIVRELKKSGMVQVIQGSMEFGARSLCNTCTLALPSKVNVRKINEINGRNTIMPMAPVVVPEMLDCFEDFSKVHKSLEYMVCALRLSMDCMDSYDMIEGAAHFYELNGSYTCRPQIVYSGPVYKAIQEVGPLINTSLNAHGQPIVFEKESIEKCMEIQGNQIKTFVVLQ